MSYEATLDTTNNLVSLSQMKSSLGIGSGANAADDILTDLINDASWFFKEETHRMLKSQSLTEFYDGPGGLILYLRNPPTTGLSIWQDVGRDFATGSLIASTAYELNETTGRVLLTGDVFSTEKHVIKTTYMGGYSTIPFNLKRAVAVMVSQNYELNDHHALGTKSRSNDKGGTTSYLHDMLPAVKRALNVYTRTVIV